VTSSATPLKGAKNPTDDDQQPFPGPEQPPTKVGKDLGVCGKKHIEALLGAMYSGNAL
jgi:hypothetical protein